MKKLLLAGALGVSMISMAQNQVVSDFNLQDIATKSSQTDWYRFNKGVQVTSAQITEDLKFQLGFGQNDVLTRYKISIDDLGMVHERFHHYHNGVRVDGSELLVHSKDGKVVSVNGRWVKNFNRSISGAVLTSIDALNNAKAAIGARVYAWESDFNEHAIKHIFHDENATYKPTPELVWANPSMNGVASEYKLVYKMDVLATLPVSRNTVMVDANTGMIIKSLNTLCTTDVPGAAVTKYLGEQPIVTDSVAPGQFRLRESGRGGGIETYNMQEGTNYAAAVDFVDEDNYWNNVNPQQDEAAGDAHYGSEVTYDYFMNEHNWNSFDGEGATIQSYIHYDQAFANAFWDGSRMTYGDGNGNGNSSFTALDICGHEIAHGVTEFTANLVYQNEPGALNESFSDIFGAAIEFIGSPETSDWLIGEDIFTNGAVIRDMKNPKPQGNPNTYEGEEWEFGQADNGGVHDNSGVQNFWFYLLVDGAAGTNDNGDNYDVTSIGLDKAGKIAFRNLKEYLVVESQYIDAREGSIQAAIDLYGPCSPEMIEIANAWYAVGVGDPIADYDLSVVSIDAPGTACGLTDSETVTITAQYNGCNVDLVPGDEITFVYQIDGGAETREVLVLDETISGGEIFEYTFNTGADLTELGERTISVTIEFENDPLLSNNNREIVIESILQENVNVGVTALISPVSGCGLTATTPVTVAFTFFGCDSLAAGTSIDLGYAVDGANTVIENITLSETIYPLESVEFTFAATTDMSQDGAYIVDAWTEYSADFLTDNDTLYASRPVNPFDLFFGDVRTMDDQTLVLDSMTVTTATAATFEISDLAANGGEFGIRLTGDNPQREDVEVEFPDDENGPFEINEDFESKVCFCADADGMESLNIVFDRRQTFSAIYGFFLGGPLPEASALKVTIDGEQLGENFYPETENGDPFVTEFLNADEFAGEQFELCFVARTIIHGDSIGFPGVGGDEVHLDNIFLSEVIPSDLALASIVEPVGGCDLDANTPVTVEVALNCCQPLEAGTAMNVNYNFNGGAQVTEAIILSNRLEVGESFEHTFNSTVDLSAKGQYVISASVEFADESDLTNNSITDMAVTNPFELVANDVRAFNNAAVLDSVALNVASNASATIDDRAGNPGDGIRMTGGGFGFTSIPVVPDENTDPFTVNDGNASEACFCADASGMSNVHVIFDHKQTFSPAYEQFLGQDGTRASAMRVMVDGNQIGENYFAASANDDDFATDTLEIAGAAGTQFSLCFQARALINGDSIPIPGITGDDVLLDNIYITELQSVGIELVPTAVESFKVGPNPGADVLNININAINAFEGTIELVDQLGQVVMSSKVAVASRANQFTFSTVDLAKGNYFVKLNDGTSIITRQWIKVD